MRRDVTHIPRALASAVDIVRLEDSIPAWNLGRHERPARPAHRSALPAARPAPPPAQPFSLLLQRCEPSLFQLCFAADRVHAGAAQAGAISAACYAGTSSGA